MEFRPLTRDEKFQREKSLKNRKINNNGKFTDIPRSSINNFDIFTTDYLLKLDDIDRFSEFYSHIVRPGGNISVFANMWNRTEFDDNDPDDVKLMYFKERMAIGVFVNPTTYAFAFEMEMFDIRKNIVYCKYCVSIIHTDNELIKKTLVVTLMKENFKATVFCYFNDVNVIRLVDYLEEKIIDNSVKIAIYGIMQCRNYIVFKHDETISDEMVDEIYDNYNSIIGKKRMNDNTLFLLIPIVKKFIPFVSLLKY